MADIAISGMSTASSVALTDEIELNQGGASRKGTIAQVKNAVDGLSLIRQDSTYTLTSANTEQKLFSTADAAGGALTLATGTYLFECQAVITSLSATSGNGAFDILGAGTATLGSVLYQSNGRDGAVNAASGPSGSQMTQAQSPASQQTAGTATVWNFLDIGMFEVTAGGTIIPSVTLVTAAAGVVGAGSYFWCRRIGDVNLTKIGAWA